MTKNNYPITPPPELVEQWCHKWTIANGDFGPYLAIQAARWGADQELDACCEWLIANDNPRWAVALQEGRRPKPLSLKEQALAVLDDASDRLDAVHENTIRRALESLPD